MPTYKLSYFNARGRAELARLICELGDVEYEDERLDGEAWGKVKPSTPLGQMPLLYVNGEVFPQSGAIIRFLAKEAKLAGKNKLEEFKADSIVETCNDVFTGMVKFHFEKDEAKKAELKKTFVEDTVPKVFKFLEKSLNEKSGFFLESISFADLAVFDLKEKLAMVDSTLVDKSPKIQAHVKKIEANPKVAAWLKKRPVTNM